MRNATFISIILITLAALFYVENVTAIPFRTIRMKDGLSHDYIQCLLQDRYGFIWIGTSNGLNCYYGHNNKIFRNNVDNNIILPNNRVTALYDASPDTLLIGTNLGICIYERSKGTISPFSIKSKYGVTISSEVSSIISGKDNNIWIATFGQGLFRYDGRQEIEQFISESSFFTALATDTDGNLYAASLTNELLIYDSNGQVLRNIPLSDAPYCLFHHQKVLYVGMRGGLINCIGQDGEKITYSVPGPQPNIVRYMLTEQNGNLIVGTDTGLYHLQLGNEQGKTVSRNPEMHKLSNTLVTALLKDNEGGIWCGTLGEGVNYMGRLAMSFNYYYLQESPEEHDWNEQKAYVLCEMDDGMLYIGTNRGLFMQQPNSGKIQKYTGIKPYAIRVLLADGHYLWIGTYGNGLIRLNTRTKEIKTYIQHEGETGTLLSNNIFELWKGYNGKLYIGTDNGLCNLNVETGSFEQETAVGAMITVEKICEDNSHQLWIATSQNGIYRYNPENRHWKHYGYEEDTFSNNINTLKIDSKGRLLVGTNGDGMGIYDAQKDIFVHKESYGNGIAARVIHAIEEDADGNLWIVNEQGLIQYSAGGDTILCILTPDNGLPISELGKHAALRLHKGDLAFGGKNGIMTFDPRTLESTRSTLHVRITGMTFLYEHPDEDKRLNYRYTTLLPSKIELPYDHNSFNLEFAAMSYETPNSNIYRYKLDKNDKEWTQATTSNTASFTNLAPGTYHFCVQGSNGNGKWSEQPASIAITINPPWWMGTAAKIVYSIMLAAIISYIAFVWNSYVRRKYRRRMRINEARRQEETYRQKINFFVNFVHEIRTPLSLIRLPLEQIIESGGQKEENARLLSVVDTNVNYLLNISNQFLDLQRFENGGNMSLNIVECNANELTTELKAQFSETARLKNIDFITTLPKRIITARIDRDKIYNILVNLAGNALKYANTYIEITLEEDEKQILQWIVDDDGPGIPPEERNKIFETFYRIEGRKTDAIGTGIGLPYAHSLAMQHGGNITVGESPQGGARFILSLPNTQENVANDAGDELRPYDDAQSGTQRRVFTILLAEDNADLLKLTAASLSKWFIVKKATDGQKAFGLLQEKDCNIDVVVSDIMMPGMDGIELCSRVKQDINTSHIPFILLTAKTTLDSKVEGLACGADAYLEKPFSIRQLKAQIDNLLRLRQAFHQRLVQNGGDMSDIEQDESGLSERDREFLAKVKRLFEENMSSETYSIKDTADTIGMSNSNFYRKIKVLTGLTPNDYLKLTRLERAAMLLRKGERVSEVAQQIGFSSNSYLTKCFKAQFGMLPKEYREKYTANSITH